MKVFAISVFLLDIASVENKLNRSDNLSRPSPIKKGKHVKLAFLIIILMEISITSSDLHHDFK